MGQRKKIVTYSAGLQSRRPAKDFSIEMRGTPICRGRETFSESPDHEEKVGLWKGASKGTLRENLSKGQENALQSVSGAATSVSSPPMGTEMP